ncbi:Alg9-like mannosyltransferase family-domain-containing protein [Aspergillus crustosus]
MAFALNTLSDSDVFLYLLGFRLVNALVVRTFFQPDEFFQSLEPAWQQAFGKSQGAWITWEWNHQLRSSLHPLIFATVLSITDALSRTVHLYPTWRAGLLLAIPGITQAVIAALGDFYTWKFARYVYKDKSRESWATLAVTVVSPWQWFCSTRTLSNCLETTITVVAMYLWPWECASGQTSVKPSNKQGVGSLSARIQWLKESALSLYRTPPNSAAIKNLRPADIASWVQDNSRALVDSTTNTNIQGVDSFRLRLCLGLTAVACILRPTNLIIWIILASVALYRSAWRDRLILAREAALLGSSVLALTFLLDRLFYGFWTFPPLHFWHFNVVQSLATFYGRNDWSYYATQGYPLLLTTALPFTLVGLYRTVTRRAEDKYSILVQLASISLAMPALLSVITHKEVRFIYPLLPALHILSASPLAGFFSPAIETTEGRFTPRRLILIFLLLVNGVIASYTTVIHNSGVISVLSYLRDQHQIHGTTTTWAVPGQGESYGGITAGFLMPCHSTPWRSHLIEPTIHAWALSCEPPINLTTEAKATYRDEADQFYDSPTSFLRANMIGGLRHIPRRPSYASPPNAKRAPTQLYPPHEWPDYLIFFAQLEPTLKRALQLSSYGECRRIFNTAWHDDYRRRGDVVVWCLDPSEQNQWRTEKEKRELEARDREFDKIIAQFRKPSSTWEQYTATIKNFLPFTSRKSWFESLWADLVPSWLPLPKLTFLKLNSSSGWGSGWGLRGWDWSWRPWASRTRVLGIPLPRWSDLAFWRRNVWDEIWF